MMGLLSAQTGGDEANGKLWWAHVKYLADPGTLDALLNDGARRARVIAAETMKTVRDRSGFPAIGAGQVRQEGVEGAAGRVLDGHGAQRVAYDAVDLG